MFISSIFLHRYFFNNINHGYTTVVLKKKLFVAASFYMAAATYCHYEHMCKTMRSAIVSYFLKGSFYGTEAATGVLRLFLKVSQYSQEFICVSVSLQ